MKSRISFGLALSLFAVAFIWGTTFLGIGLAVKTIPPFFVAGIRNLIAGISFTVFLLLTHKFVMPSKKAILDNVLMSFLMIIMANGMTTLAQKHIPSGLTSLLLTVSPIIVMILNVATGKERLSLRSVLGLLACCLGMMLIFRDNLTDLFNPAYLLGMMALGVATMSWALGTVMAKKRTQIAVNSVFTNIAIQMLVAGMFLSAMGMVFSRHTDLGTWSLQSWLGVVYLAVFGSILGQTAYYYALSKMSASKVIAFTYFNPVFAVLLGWLVLNERVSWMMIVSGVLIIIGVALISIKDTHRKVLK